MSTAGPLDTNLESPLMDEDSEVDKVLKEWSDVQYTLLDKPAVLTVEIPQDFLRIHSLMYAVKQTGECSDRALRLAAAAIRKNPSNPSAWMFRRSVAIVIARAEPKRTWAKELAFASEILLMSPKNYQAWQYRRFVSEIAHTLPAELEFVEVILQDDQKNYHAWSHRHWLAREHRCVQGELEATEWFIRSDIRNNSAWNHRWLITGLVEGARCRSELQFAVDIMTQAPRNESVWDYIHAMGKAGVDVDWVKPMAEQVLETDAGCLAARRFLVLNALKADAKEVAEHCHILANVIDPVRRRYWEAQEKTARSLLEQ